MICENPVAVPSFSWSSFHFQMNHVALPACLFICKMGICSLIFIRLFLRLNETMHIQYLAQCLKLGKFPGTEQVVLLLLELRHGHPVVQSAGILRGRLAFNCAGVQYRNCSTGTADLLPPCHHILMRAFMLNNTHVWYLTLFKVFSLIWSHWIILEP